MMGRVVEGLVALGVLASAGILIGMLAAPFVPAPPGDAAAATPSVGPSASAASSVDPGMPPLGIYELRGPLGVTSRCLGLELGPQAYPLAAGAEGSATVFAWTSPVSDAGNPEACEGRVGDLLEIPATVTRVADEDDPDGPAVGYALRFHLPVAAGPGEIDQEIVILSAQSSSELIQALDMTTSGSGLVFERVGAIDPPLVAAPSPSPQAALPSGRLFLLRGPLDDDGPCLVLDTGTVSEAAPQRTGAVRWWQPGNPDPTDPTACLGRVGDVHSAPVEIVRVSVEGGPSAGTSYVIRFSLPGAAGRERGVVLDAPADLITPDSFTAFVVEADDRRALTFDRVDSIDPPLASPGP